MDLPPFEELFGQINTNLRVSGIDAYRRLGFMFWFPYLSLLQIAVEEFCFFVAKTSSENLLELTALAPCFSIAVLSLAKIICIALSRNRIFELTENLKLLYNDVLVDPNKREIIGSEVRFVKFLTKYFFILNAVLVSVYNFSALIFIPYDYYTKGEIIFSIPYAVLLPFSINTWLRWSVVYIHSIVFAFYCVFYITTADALYYNLSSHVCNNFIVLNDEIQRLEYHTNVGQLIGIIKKHQYILKLSEDLEYIFSAPNLFNVLVGSVEICALGFNLMTGDWGRMPGFILFLITVLIQIFLMSMFGENLIRESRNIGHSVFLCEWYKMNPVCKKLMLIIMIRANKPQRLTAYKFSTICYQSFSRIISTSWSYFTILRTVYKSSDLAPTE